MDETETNQASSTENVSNKENVQRKRIKRRKRQQMKKLAEKIKLPFLGQDILFKEHGSDQRIKARVFGVLRKLSIKMSNKLLLKMVLKLKRISLRR